MMLLYFTEAERSCWWLVDFGGREGKGIQGHFDVDSEGDLEKNGIIMNRQFTMK